MKRIILAATVALILLIVSATILLGYTIYWIIAHFLGYPPSIDLPLEARLPGLILIGLAIMVILDVMRYRRPPDVLISTADTFTKLIKRKPLEERTLRTEPFVPKGPYVWVRNPMYFAVVMLAFGIGVSFASTPLLFWGLVVTCWFWFFQIPLEERELQALFGERYKDYKRQVPKLFPYGKRYRQVQT